MSSKMSVGAVERHDRSEILELAKQFHSETVFNDLDFSEDKFNKKFEKAFIDNPSSFGIKVTRSSDIVGFCSCQIGDYFLSEDARIVTVDGIFVSEAIRTSMLGGRVALLLLRGLTNLARSINAHSVLVFATSGNNAERTDRVFRRFGMKTLGGNYIMKL